MPQLRRCALLAASAALALPALAQAAVYPAEVVDGPTGELLSAGDVDVARDGTGAVAYLKRDGGVPHLFVSRLVGGAFQPPERLDGALPGPAGEPVVAASDGGRIAVAFTSGGQLNAVLRPNASAAFQAPQPVADGASAPDIDMSINGVGYISFTSGADVRVARLARDGGSFALLPEAIDIAPPRPAGEGAGRSKVAVSADGTAVVVWGEAGQVFGRRIFGTRLSVAPQELSIATVDGHAGGAADSPEVDIEDDSSYAWATFRQRFDDGRDHVVARRLVGSSFETPTFVDGLGYPAPADAQETALELNGRGLGISATSAGGGLNAAILFDDKFGTGAPLGPGTASSKPAVGLSESNEAFAAWLPGDGSVRLRGWDLDPRKRVVPPPGPPSTISRTEFGPVVADAGMDMAMNRVGDASAVFLQEGPDGRRLVAGGFDRPPGTFRGTSTTRFRKLARPVFAWSTSFDLWGPVRYRVEVDGQPVGETTETRLTPLNPVADGRHTWRVVATDRRGQTQATPLRLLRIDATPPTLKLRVTGTRKRGRAVKVVATASDRSPTPSPASGIKTVRIDWGDKTTPLLARSASHRYGRSGSFVVRVSATDAAGNATVVRQTLRIKK